MLSLGPLGKEASSLPSATKNLVFVRRLPMVSIEGFMIRAYKHDRFGSQRQKRDGEFGRDAGKEATGRIEVRHFAWLCEFAWFSERSWTTTLPATIGRGCPCYQDSERGFACAEDAIRFWRLITRSLEKQVERCFRGL